MASQDTELGVSSSYANESLGHLIAMAREARSISPGELAIRLRLDTKMIKALERDDFENLPAPTFVKGYIRSIAKELDINAAPLLEAYGTHASLEPPSLADYSSRPPDQISVNSTIMRSATYGLGILLVVLIVLWWRSAERGAASRPAMDEQEIAAMLGADPLPYTYAVVEHDELSWRVQRTPIADDDANSPGVDDNSGTTLEGEADGTELVLGTTSEAWIEIYTAADKRLFFGMANATKPIELNGHPYYRLIIGNSDSVNLVYRGEAIDLAPLSTDGVAQFELGKKPKSADE